MTSDLSPGNHKEKKSPRKVRKTSDSQWDYEELILDGDEYFSKLKRAIWQAKKSIYLETYIFERGELGTDLILALRSAAMRGVEVKILVDGIGSHLFPDSFVDLIAGGGGEIKIFHPIPFAPINFWDFKAPLAMAAEFFSRWGVVNKRNHRKVAIFDRESAFVGSFNILDDVLPSLSKEDYWVEHGVLIRGKQVSDLVRSFQAAYQGRGRLKRLRRRMKLHQNIRSYWAGSLLRLNYTRKLRRWFNEDLVQRIGLARKRVWIVTPYFFPDYKIVDTLMNIQKKGVEVVLLTSRKNDVWLSKTLAQYYFGVLLRSGVQIYEFLPTLLHAKNYFIDDYVFIGSSNFNHRSLLHDLEADVVLSKDENIEKLEDEFKKNLSKADQLKLSDFEKRSLWDKILCRVFLLLKYWV